MAALCDAPMQPPEELPRGLAGVARGRRRCEAGLASARMLGAVGKLLAGEADGCSSRHCRATVMVLAGTRLL